MSFAQKILEKYGWKEGDGLGKNNDGIAKPLKASLKFDNTGLGVDKAADFNNHWWERVFNEAANNVQIEKDDGKISMILKNKDSVEITTKDYSVRKLKQKKRDAYENFLSSATLTNTGDEVKNPYKIDVDEIKVSPYKPLTDEELFEACGRRTAHKGARHGLKLSGKLARIEQQEKELLKKMQEINSETSQPWTVVKKKKNKRLEKNEVQQSDHQDADTKLESILYTAEYCIKSKKKRKEKKKTEQELTDYLETFSLENKIESNALLGISLDSKSIKKLKILKKSKKKGSNADWNTYRSENKPDVENTETKAEQVGEELEDISLIYKKKKSKKCKHGIDKDAKEAHKHAKKLKKSLQRVTEDFEKSVLVAT